MSRQYYLKKKSTDRTTLADITSTGDEFVMITKLAEVVFADLSHMLRDGDLSPTEAYDIVRGLENVDKEALMDLERLHHKVKVNLIDEFYEITVINI